MRCGDDDLTGDQSSLGDKSLKMIKVNVELCLLSLLESETRIKSSKCRVVFAVIVGEQDTGKKR